MTVVAPSPMTFSHSDNDLARQLGLLGEQLDSNLSQEFAGLPSIDLASILNCDVLAPSPVKLESRTVSQSAEQDAQDADSDADASDSDADSSGSDDDTAAAPQQPETPHHLRGDLPENSSPLVAAPASQPMCNIPTSSAALPLHGTSSSLRVSHPAMPHTSQGFVALSDINTASGQGHSHSVSSSPSSALGGTSSNPFEHANSGSVLAEQQKGKRKADQMELDTILDPAEKKKQRRLAKNRATAALSRERKKAQLQVLQQRVRALEQENTSLAQALALRDAEIKRLKDRGACQTKGTNDTELTAPATTEVAKNFGPRIVYPSVSALPRIYRSVANPPSSSFPHQPRAPSSGHPPVGATTHYPQRSVFSAPILEHHTPRSEQPSMPRSEQHHPTHSSTVQNQSVHAVQSKQPTHSHSVHPTQSGQQISAAAAGVESASQQEESSRVKLAAASGCQPESTVSIQPSTQTPFNVVTSGESGHLLSKQRQSHNSAATAAADKQHMGPPVVDGFNTQISPFVAQSEHSLHIQHAPQPAPASDAGPQKNYGPGLSGRSGSYTYGTNYPHAAFNHSGGGQASFDHNNSNCYAPTHMQSHLSSQGSAGFNTMPQSVPQYQYQPQHQHHVPSNMQSWAGYEEVRTSPRHPGAWHWSDGMGQNLGQNLGQNMGQNLGQSHMEGLNHSGSTNWDSQQAQSSQFSMPSQPDWQEPQPWRSQQADGPGTWAGPVRPPWPPQAIAVTPQGSAFGHTVGPLTEPHRLPGELEPPACRWMASANSALAEMFPGQ